MTLDLNIIRQRSYENLNNVLNSVEYGVFCNLHGNELYGETAESSHNCIGCNLNEYAQILVNSLKYEFEIRDEFELFSRFIINAYILTERIRCYTKILSISDENFNMQFSTLRMIIKWANFIKHPKAFMLVHTPKYYFTNQVEINENVELPEIIINQEFINTYYSGGQNNPALFEILTNKRDVKVIFPELEKLTNDFSIDCQKFIALIIDNESYRNTLKDKTTLQNFFNSDNEMEE